MRPLDQGLKRRYVEAATLLHEQGEEVTTKKIAQQLGAQWKAVRRYLHRHEKFAAMLGVSIRKPSDEEDYTRAVSNLYSRGVKITCENIAKELGVGSSSVARFLKKRPWLRERQSSVSLEASFDSDVVSPKPLPTEQPPVPPPAPSAVEKPQERLSVLPPLASVRKARAAQPTTAPTPPVSKEPPAPEPEPKKKAPVERQVVKKRPVTPPLLSRRAEVEWQPRIHSGPILPLQAGPTPEGKKPKREDITVEYLDERTMRFPLDKVTPRRYVDLARKGLLKYQQQGLPRPDFLPDPAEVAEELGEKL